jgi:uncharacterized protein YdhG (YjbR/CyaY superfamily)
MNIKAESVEDYLEQLPVERKQVLCKLRQVIQDHLPEGVEETMSYGMIGYVVPHSVYPPGYHCDPKLPLPFINLASQKNHVALYHCCIYAAPGLTQWFESEYPKHSSAKLDMGKGCIRFKKMDQIPYALVGELVGKVSVNEYIRLYESNVKR